MQRSSPQRRYRAKSDLKRSADLRKMGRRRVLLAKPPLQEQGALMQARRASVVGTASAGERKPRTTKIEPRKTSRLETMVVCKSLPQNLLLPPRPRRWQTLPAPSAPIQAKKPSAGGWGQAGEGSGGPARDQHHPRELRTGCRAPPHGRSRSTGTGSPPTAAPAPRSRPHPRRAPNTARISAEMRRQSMTTR